MNRREERGERGAGRIASDQALWRGGLRDGQSSVQRRRGLGEELTSGYLALAALHRAFAAECPDADSTTHQLMYADSIERIAAALREELDRVERRIN
jgi:hypothetical protein